MADQIVSVEGGDSQERVERFERIQPLTPGFYWRATQDVPNTRVKAGEVLLLLQVRRVNARFHSVVLLDHPSRQSARHQVQIELLTEELLEAFEPAPDGEQVREREVAAIQGQVQQMQTDLINLQSNPQLLRALVDDRVQPVASLGADSPESTAIRGGLPATHLMDRGQLRTDVAFALEKGLTQSDVAAMYAVAEHESRRAETTANILAERVTAISQTIGQLTPFFAEKGAVALAKTAEVREYANEIMSGIASLDLYTGKGVEVVTVAKGQPAPAGEPLTLLQRKLFLDEEIAVWLDVDETFDHTDLGRIDEYLANHPSFRDQLLPSPRSVVSVAIRRSDVNYNDPWANSARNALNKQVFLLVRNGENIHRVYSVAPSHEHAMRLFPTHDEFENLFKGYDGSRITYNDIQYADKHKAAKDTALHYKRFLILLAGLDHRLRLFGDFYPQEDALKFISMDFQASYFRFAHDDDRERILGNEPLSLRAFMKEKNAVLQSGSRVIFFAKDLIDETTAPSAFSYSGGQYYQSADLIDSEIFKIVSRRDKELVIDLAMRKNTYNDSREFNAKVVVGTVDGTKVSDGVLCLDAVTADELARFIYNRESRVNHLAYLRLFRRAHAHLVAEAREAEATLASLTQDVLAGGLTHEPAEAREWVDEAVSAWRVSNRGAPVPALSQISAINTLRDQIHQRHQGVGMLERRVREFIAENGLQPLKLVLTGRNKPVLYVVVPEAERAPGLPWHWVKRLTLRNLKTKLSVERDSLDWLTERETPDEVVLKTWDALPNWTQPTPAPVTGKAWVEAHERLTAVPEGLKSHFGDNGWNPEWFDEALRQYRHLSLSGSRRSVTSTVLQVPIAACYHDGKLTHIALSATPDDVLYHFGNDAQKAAVEDMLGRIYANPDPHIESLKAPMTWGLMAMERQPGGVLEMKPYNDVERTRAPSGLQRAKSYPDPTGGSAWARRIVRSAEDALTHWVLNPDQGESIVLAAGVWDTDAHVARLPSLLVPKSVEASLKPTAPDDDCPTFD